jgi:hypothetical protein
MSEPYVEICEAGHRHARLEPSDGCPFCLREGKVALQKKVSKLEEDADSSPFIDVEPPEPQR